MDLVKKVETVLRDTFALPDEIHLEDNDGIVGWVASARFRGLEFIDRINLIWDALDQKLTKGERRRVLTIAAVTPEEAAAHRARREPAGPSSKPKRRVKSR